MNVKSDTMKELQESNDEVVNFIRRRFPTDCKWMTGNCFYFAQCLLGRFPSGCIMYDVINLHFVFQYEGNYYDWTGQVHPDGILVAWNEFEAYDRAHYLRIIRDCIE